ncbi:MAG: SH3 domain-containing protein [Verrucomicrobia bacterium]|nr:SH3 domain-containing protein [Verrucomicrobiota bacterium]
MKTKYGLLLTMMLSSGVIAQPAATTQPSPAPVTTAVPAPAVTAAPTNAPAAQPVPKKPAAKKKKAATTKKTAAVQSPAPALPPGPAVVSQRNVNVRGRAAINSEVVTHLNLGDNVTVLEEITLKKPKQDEPARWARIAFPTSAHVWVHGSFVDATNKTVLPAKLNVRSGPGENYSVVGLLQRGETVKQAGAKNEWLEIDAPTNAYAFVAAHLLTAKPTVVAAAEPPPAAPAPATETAKVETPPAVAPVVETPAPAPATATPAPATEPPAATPAPPEKEEEPLPPRIVEREGIVRGTVSIQAPSHYRLVSPDTGRTINYLYSPTTNLVLKPYNGLRIVVTGEEGLDERWTNTPVITIQKIHVVE